MDRHHMYTVVVSNIGIIHECEDELCAKKSYNDYVKLSSDNVGIAGGEEVSLLKDGDAVSCYAPIKQSIEHLRFLDDVESANEIMYNEYYKATVKTIMVPVKVSYHEPTKVIYKIFSPTNADIEEAFKNDCSQCSTGNGEHSCGDNQIRGKYCSQCGRPGDFPIVSFGHGLTLHSCKDCVSAK